MSGYGFFAVPTLGMMSQSHALSVIGENIANVTTGGYKRTDTQFATVLSQTIDKQSDLGGVLPNDYQRISEQGLLMASSRDQDLAINGNGFFILNTKLNGSGETLYTRDGSFIMKTANPVTTADTTGQTNATNTAYEGYLVDKNGFFVQGWSANPTTGAFSNTGTLSALRIDRDAFSNTSLPTTTASLGLNLPATDLIANAQTDTVTIAGTIEAADTYSITVDGTTITTTVGGAADINAVRNALVTAINANATVGAIVTAATTTGTGALTLTAKAVNSSFTATTAATNGGGTADNTALLSTTQTADDGSGIRAYNIDMIDSTGTQQSARLNFLKSAVNTWQMTNTTSRAPVAQLDTITLAGTIEAGDTYSVTINGNVIPYSVSGGEANINAVRDALVIAINANSSVSSNVTAAAGAAAGQITITADTAGTAFTASAAAVHGGTSVAQVDTVTLAGTIEAGDIFSYTIGVDTASYTVLGGDTLTDVRNNLFANINLNVNLAAQVTAAAGGAAGQLTITADTAGTAFTGTPSVIDAGTIDATAAAATTTANVTAQNDNTAPLVNTTANVINTQTSAIQTLSFGADGQLTNPSAPLSLSFAYANGGTATVALDLSDLSQFGGGFTPTSFTRNGSAAAEMRSFNFDNKGQIVATFENATFRPIYKLPLALFSNPNALEMRNGNTLARTAESGTASVVAADISGQAQFVPGVRELSNVDLADEFTKMIITQQAYNSSANVFRTLDEMTQTAAELKR